MIKQESILALKEKIDVLEVVKEYFPNPRRRGRNYFVHCPFHSERTPSFSISPDKKIVHCFGCGYNGDIIKFVQDMDHITYFDAVEKLAKKINFKLEYSYVDKEKYNEKKLLLEVLNEISLFYNEILLKDKVSSGARKYLALRGIKPETIEKFRLGFAPEGNCIVTNFKKYDLSTLYKAGVINFYQLENEKDVNKKYDHPYDYFRGRIIFPVYNISGQVISFGGRILPDSVSSLKNVPSYLNGPDTVVFNKGSNLYGLFQGKDEIVKRQMVNIVEGYMDVLMLHQENFTNTVAPLGTALTESQVRVLRRFTENICIIFDPDQGGRNATISVAQTVFRCDLFPQTILLPENMDPDEYVLHYGTQKFQELLFNPRSVIKFAIDHYLKILEKEDIKNLSTKEKIFLLKKIVEIITVITNPVAKSDAIKETSEMLDISEEILRSEIKKHLKKSFNSKDESFDLNKKPYSCEEELLYLCIHNPQVLSEVPCEVFEHNLEYLHIFKKIKEKFSVTRDISQVIEELPSPLKEKVIQMVFDYKEDDVCVEQKVMQLYEDIAKAKNLKRYKELKPIVTKMLEGEEVDHQIINEFKQLVEILKK
ncbi:MAG: DNA primase [Endomicrobiia bacterium]